MTNKRLKTNVVISNCAQVPLIAGTCICNLVLRFFSDFNKTKLIYYAKNTAIWLLDSRFVSTLNKIYKKCIVFFILLDSPNVR